MAITLTWNGITYSIPDPGEVGWGENLDAFFVALPAGALQKTGGAFTLTAETDFGAGFGLKALSYKSRTANVSTAGNLRLAKTDSVGWRNNANDANLLLAINGSNELTFNGSPLVTGETSTFAANRVIVSDSGGALSALSAGSAGMVLTSNGASAPSFSNTTGSGTVNSGTAGRFALYPAIGATIDDTYTQNANLISLAIATHTGLSSTRTYTVPDPGRDASLVMSEGITGIGFTENLLYADSTLANGFGSTGRIGFGTATPSFRYHFYADGDPLLFQLTYVGDPFTGMGGTGVLGPLANNIWWDKGAGAVAASPGDAGFLGTIIFNTDLGGGLVGHEEMAEIGVVVVDANDATRTARMQFELNSNGASFQTETGKSFGGAFMTLDPILTNGATLKVGPGESIVSTAPINGGAYLSSDDYSNAILCAGAQYMGSNVYTARGTDPVVLDLGAATPHTFRICTDSSQTSGNALVPTERYSLNSVGAAYSVPLSMGSNKITSLADGVSATDAATVGQLMAFVPSGAMTMYGGTSAPTGWLLCDGTSYLRASYPDLFTAIGTTFGAADGTHFNVPDCRDNTPVGKSGTKALGSTGGASTHVHAMPHKHRTAIAQHSGPGISLLGPDAFTKSGSFSGGYTQGTTTGSDPAGYEWVYTDSPDTSDTASGSSYAPYLALNYIIKT